MLCLKNVVKEYGDDDNKVVALKGVSIDFRRSDLVSILGPSGCGKTTLLNIIGGLDKYTSGDLVINGTSTKDYNDRDWDTYRNHSVGFVFQTYNLIPHQTVLKNVELALTLSGVNKSERKERAIKALEEVGLKDKINKKPNQLSGGQMQRVAIARALVNNPEIILADEPTGALDTETSVQVMDILKNVSKDRLVIMVTHNPELAEKYSSRIIRMLDGEVIGDSSPYVSKTPVVKPKKEKGVKTKKAKKPTMSFWTAFNLSLKNLFTKKGRTVLTSFAGSIGIIGIALILAVSEGTTGYINHVQETTLASYPLAIEETSVDLTSLMKSFMNVGKDDVEHDKDAIYKDQIISDLVNALGNTKTNSNNLKSFKKFLIDEVNTEGSKLSSAVSGLQYTYNLDFSVYTKNVDEKIIKSDTGELMTEMISKYMLGKMTSGGGTDSSTSSGMTSSPMLSMASSGLWQEMLSGLDGEVINKTITEQYELIDGGSWPNEYDEIVLVVNENNELDDLTLYALGLLEQKDIDKIIDSAIKGEQMPEDTQKWKYSEIKSRTYKVIMPYDCYNYNKENDIWEDISENISKNEVLLAGLYNDALELKVTGIVRPKKGSDANLLSSGIGYTSLLTEYIINQAKESDVYTAQAEEPTVDIFTGKPFNSNTGSLTNEEKKTAFINYVDGMSAATKAEIYVKMLCVDAEEKQLKAQTDAILSNYTDKNALVEMIAATLAEQMGWDTETIKALFADMSLEELKTLIRPTIEEKVKEGIALGVKGQLEGVSDNQKVALLTAALAEMTDEQAAKYYDEITEFSTSTYEDNLVKMGCLDIDSPSSINIYSSTFKSKDVIEEEIARYNKGVEESDKIAYTDYVGLMMSSVTQIVDAVTYVLIAFVSISLIVSSIMIGVITLISVQERTKEIGILRAIGASKKDVSSMFNAETLIIGFASGLFGVLITYLLCIPINIILYALTGIAKLQAMLPISGAIILILISMALTLIAGIIPSRSASKKDPVVALRTE